MAVLWVVVLVLGFLALTALISGSIIYFQYCNSPVKRWSNDVLTLLGNARRKLRAEQQSFQRLDQNKQQDVDGLTERAFRSFLTTVNIEQLQVYPGIGPGTVGKLQDAGYTNVAQLRGAYLRIHGLGQKRLGDITAATRHLVEKARGRFRVETCAEARGLSNEIAELDWQYKELKHRAKSRIDSIDALINQIAELANYARNVTFFRYLRPVTETPPVPPEIQEIPLPDLEDTIRKADRVASAAFAEWRRKTVRQSTSGSRIERKPEREEGSAQEIPTATPVVTVRVVSPTRQPRSSSRKAPTVQTDQKKESATLVDKEGRPPFHVRVMEATIQLALAVARADGPVTSAERDVIREEIRRRYARDTALYNQAHALYSYYEKAAIDLQACLGAIRKLIPIETRAGLIRFLSHIVGASGPISSQAAAYLVDISRALDSPWQLPPAPAVAETNKPQPHASPVRVVASKPESQAYEPNKRRAGTSPEITTPKGVATTPLQPQPPDYRKTLEIGVAIPLSPDLVRRQYRLLRERYAPEREAARGQDFVALAEKRCLAVRAATAALLKEMGEKFIDEDNQPKPKELRENRDLDEVFGV